MVAQSLAIWGINYYLIYIPEDNVDVQLSTNLLHASSNGIAALRSLIKYVFNMRHNSGSF